jgi:radical SAM superfamily enzyme YgiQ (UPF0313 family)
VGSAVGLGFIGAIIYFVRRMGRRSPPESREEAEQEPEGGGDDHKVDNAAVAAGDAKSMEKLPAEAEAIPAKIQKHYVAELPGDTVIAELSDSRRILELGDGRKYHELM